MLQFVRAPECGDADVRPPSYRCGVVFGRSALYVQWFALTFVLLCISSSNDPMRNFDVWFGFKVWTSSLNKLAWICCTPWRFAELQARGRDGHRSAQQHHRLD